MFDLISISEAIKRSYDSEGLLVDVRSEEVFKKGHLPMAVNLPFEEIMDEKFDIEAIEKDFNIEKEQPQVCWRRRSLILWEFTHTVWLAALCFIKDT